MLETLNTGTTSKPTAALILNLEASLKMDT
jgi:hypothetical protein